MNLSWLNNFINSDNMLSIPDIKISQDTKQDDDYTKHNNILSVIIDEIVLNNDKKIEIDSHQSKDEKKTIVCKPSPLRISQISDKQTIDEKIYSKIQVINPFFIEFNNYELAHINNIGLSTKFQRTLILCLAGELKKNITNSKNFDAQVQIICNSHVSPHDLNIIKDHFTLISCPIEFVFKKTHRMSSKIVSSDDLQQFNHNNIKLYSEEIVVIMINTYENILRDYVKLYDYRQNIIDMFPRKLLFDIYKNDDSNVLKKFRTQMFSGDNYWSNKFNCALNMTSYYNSRRFSYKGMIQHNAKNKKELNTNNKIDNYNEFMIGRTTYTDISKAVRFKDYVLYVPPKETITREQVNNMYKICATEHDVYVLTSSILMSVNNFHHVLNNKTVLEQLNTPNSFGVWMKNKSFMMRYAVIMKYLIGYCWLAFYIEEALKNKDITDKDRFVYDADTACQLPFFPYLTSDPHLNPYLPILVSHNILNNTNNMWGLKMIEGYQYQIANTKEFIENFNIFTTGFANKNILDGIDWSNIVVSGSSMTACSLKKHPALVRYAGNHVSQKNQLYNDLYKDSDIDVIVYNDDIFEYINKVINIHTTIKENVKSYYKRNDVSITATKSLVFIVSTEYMKQKYPQYDLDYIIANMDKTCFKEKFYQTYINLKIENNDVERIKLGKSFQSIYEHHFSLVNVSEMRIFLVNDVLDKYKQNNYDNEYYIRQNSAAKPSDKKFKDTSPVLMKISEGLKFHISSSSIKHSLELFRIKSPEWFSIVSRFHVPTVRMYFDGKNVRMLPSKITTDMTFMNLDYKYFAGTKDPGDIIIKNASRFVGLFLNNVELHNVTRYCSESKKWKSVTKDSKIPLGGMGIQDNITKPGLFDSVENKIDSDRIKYENVDYKYVMTDEQFINEYKNRFGYSSDDSSINLLKLKTINKKGFVEPLNVMYVVEAFDLLKNL
jgi:hypothetical protein